jgi:hypothetical protein
MDAFQLLEEAGNVPPADDTTIEAVLDLLLIAAFQEGSQLDLAGSRSAAADANSVGRHAPWPRLIIASLTGASDAFSQGQAGHQHRWALRVAAVAVALAAVAVGSSVLLPGGSTPAAAAVLKNLARVAAAQPAPPVPNPGQYLYADSVGTYTSSTCFNDCSGSPAIAVANTFSWLVPEHRQIWIGANGSGRLIETFGQPTFPSAQNRALWLAAGSPVLPTSPVDASFGPGGLGDGPTNLASLPTEPSALANEIASRKIESGPPGPAEDFSQVGDLLRETDASPALRSALFQVAAGLPGVEVLGAVTDHSGQTGVGLGYVHNGVRQEFIFDPKTSSLLGEQDTVVGPGSSYHAPVGTVIDWAVYLQPSIVHSIAPRPSSSVMPGLSVRSPWSSSTAS